VPGAQLGAGHASFLASGENGAVSDADTVTPTGPLAGVRVLDLTSVILGPYATQILGDYGADVIKVESPAGDNMRFAAPMREPGMGHIFLQLNRNKRSVVLDLKHPDGRAAALRLAEHADVLVHNLRPRAISRLGLSYEDVRAVNDGIVFVGAYGFRSDGPYGARAAYDDIIQGLVALPWLLAEAAGRPLYVPATICDRVTGLNAVNAVLAALFHRERTGHGQEIEVTMFEALTELVLGDHMGGETWSPAISSMGYPRLLAPDRNPMRTKDGYLGLIVYTDRQWRSFLETIGRPGLLSEDSRFTTLESRSRHIAEVYAWLAEQIAERTTADWLELLEPADVPAMPIHSLDSLLRDPHHEATGFFRLVDHPTEGTIRTMDVPSRWSASPPSVYRHAPSLGEHTDEVLAEVGYTSAELERLCAAGVTIAGGEPGA
jgi:crotonobetainyl-CoA:carnitine CoA-transferase CaiB-like acyl-CoA transferase